MKIAVIDDGVARNVLPLPVRCFEIKNGNVLEAERKASARSHGTVCAKMVAQGVRDAEIISLAVYDENRSGREEDLLAALRWCQKNPVDYINLSNGITAGLQNGDLNEVCRKLWEQGTLIFAGISNDWEYTLPAQLPWVTGVSGRWYFFRRRYNPFVRADVRSFSLYLTRDESGKVRWYAGNSFACARALNHVIRKEQRSGILPERRLSRHVMDLSLLDHVFLVGREMPDTGLLAFPPSSIADPANDDILTAVVTSAEDPHAALRRMAPYAKKIRLLVWCGRNVPVSLRKWCSSCGIALWKGPGRKGKAVRDQDLSGFFDTFMIGITEGEQASRDAAALRRCFSEAGYSVMLFSDNPRDIVYGAVAGRSFPLLCRAREAVNPDIMIVLLPADAGARCDLRITCKEKELCLETEDGKDMVLRSGDGTEYTRILELAEQRSINGVGEKD